METFSVRPNSALCSLVFEISAIVLEPGRNDGRTRFVGCPHDDYALGYQYSPILDQKIRKYLNKTNDSWRLNETYLKIKGINHYLYRAVGTAEDILTKSDKLSTSEYEEIKKHPLKGAQILSAVSMLKTVVPIVQNHHERIDGKGYPTGLKGEQIPLLSRIIAVADAYDAMTSDRNYRKKLDPEIAKEQLLTGRGSQFDSEIVEKFINVLDNYDGRAGPQNDSQFRVIGYLCS